VILDVVLLHADTHVFLDALTVVFLELERVLQQDIAECGVHTVNHLKLLLSFENVPGNCTAWKTDVNFVRDIIYVG